MTALFLPAPLQAQCLAKPQAWALCTGRRQHTWASLLARVRHLATWYRSLGVGQGTKVAPLGRTSVALIEHIHALWFVGAELVALAPTATCAEAAALGAHCRPQQVVIFDAACAAAGAALGGRAPLEAPSDAALLPHASDDDGPGARLTLEQTLVHVATSGTSGAAKAIALSVGQLVFSAMGVASRLGHLPADRWLLTLPLHHVGGLSILWRALLLGSTVELQQPFDAAAAALRLSSGDITLAALVPTMLARILNAWPAQRRVPPQLRAVVLGGAATPEPLATRALALGLPIAISWGMTEAGSQISTRWPGEPGPPGDVGPPLPFVEVGRDAGTHALLIDGPVTGGVPYTTRDAGEVVHGRVHVHGRLDDVIISGGENISPDEIERVLLEHPSIADAGVCGVADAVWGQRPQAFVVLQPGVSPPSDEQLLSFCRARLASFKIPRAIRWVDALPRDGLGKLRRYALAAAVQ